MTASLIYRNRSKSVFHIEAYNQLIHWVACCMFSYFFCSDITCLYSRNNQDSQNLRYLYFDFCKFLFIVIIIIVFFYDYDFPLLSYRCLHDMVSAFYHLVTFYSVFSRELTNFFLISTNNLTVLFTMPLFYGTTVHLFVIFMQKSILIYIWTIYTTAKTMHLFIICCFSFYFYFLCCQIIPVSLFLFPFNNYVQFHVRTLFLSVHILTLKSVMLLV